MNEGSIAAACVLAMLLAGCGDDRSGDAGAGSDAGRTDAARPDDAGSPDASGLDASGGDASLDAGSDDAGPPDAGPVDAGAIACGSTECLPRAPECSWEGIDRIEYGLECITPTTDPRCVYPATRSTCSYACVAGACVDPACTDSAGTQRIDSCGDAVDEDCDGTACGCHMPTHLGDFYETVTLYSGLTLDRSLLDIWTLAADHPDYYVSAGVHIRNMAGVDVGYSVNGAGPITIAAGAETYANNVGSWTTPGTVNFSCPGCTDQTLTIGYYTPPEPHARFVGAYTEDGGATSYPATLELQVIPLPLASSLHPKTLRECMCWNDCVAWLDLRVTIELPGGTFVHHHAFDPDTALRARIIWDGATRRVEVRFLAPTGEVGGDLAGPPERLAGTIYGGSLGGDLLLHLE